MFLVLLVDLSVSPLKNSKRNQPICNKLSPEVYLGPRNNRIHFGDDTDYDLDSGSALRSNHMHWY